MYNMNSKSMGLQSPIEYTLKLGGVVARLITIIVEVDDVMILG